MGGRGYHLGSFVGLALASIAAMPAVAEPASRRGRTSERVYRASHSATQRKPKSDSLKRLLGKQRKA